MIAGHKRNSYVFSALAAILLAMPAATALTVDKSTTPPEEKKAAENAPKENIKERTFVTIVAGADGQLVHWDGEQLEWGDFCDMLGNLADKKNTVLEVGFKPGIIPDNKNSDLDEWLDKNDVYKKAGQLVRELGLERVSLAGQEDPPEQRASVSMRTERKLVLGEETALGLKTLELRPVLDISKVTFERRHGNLIARLRLGVRSVPHRLWDIGVRLLDEEGRQKDSAGINFENTGKVGIFPQIYKDEIEIDLGLADIQAGDTFEVRLSDIIRPKRMAGTGELRVPGDSVPTLYWTDSKSKKIQCWDANEQIIKDLVVDPAGYINDIEIDHAAKKMYWTDSYQNLIRCANLDGSDIKNIITSGLSGPENIFFDSQTNKIYWVDWMTDNVHRANADGSNIENVITKNMSIPNGVAIDPDSRKLYSTDSGGKKIQQSNLDGTDIRTLPIDNLGYPRAIAIDPEQRKIYWTDLYPSRIRRANLDGSGAEDIVVDVAAGPCVLSLDIVDRKVYWTELGLGLIRRANFDGSDVEIVVSGLANPRGIRVYREKKKPTSRHPQ
ncbi:MAG: hypothetical protein ACYS8Z_23535 [Planctomycetota bacterium]